MPYDDPLTADAASPDGPSRAPSGSMSATPGGTRLGRYQLVVPLAEGGMGVVFAGRLVGAHGVERLVAIKTLRPFTSAADRAALLREARLTARLRHRNVVATLDLGEVENQPYIVMELVEGASLSRLLARLASSRQLLSPPLAAWIVMQAALGLHVAHELTDEMGRPLGLVHRDVSPHNILLSTAGEVKIADFGIAKYAGADERTSTGMIKGKFAYMSPEQARCDALDRRSDVFVLGVVLWEALAGERLFACDTPARTLLRVLEHEPAPPRTLRGEIGGELSDIVMRCLDKDPEGRFPTALALSEALRKTLRTRLDTVDETDLAELVGSLFGAECAELAERIRAYRDDPDADHGLAGNGATGHLALALAAGRVGAESSPRRAVRVVGITGALVAAVLGGSAIASRMLPARPLTESPSRRSERPRPEPVPMLPEPTPLTLPTAAAASTANADAPVVEPASRGRALPATTLKRRAAAGPAPESVKPRPSPASSSPPPAKEGAEPFDSL